MRKFARPAILGRGDMKNRGIKGNQGVQAGVQIGLFAMCESCFHWRNGFNLESLQTDRLGIQANS